MTIGSRSRRRNRGIWIHAGSALIMEGSMEGSQQWHVLRTAADQGEQASPVDPLAASGGMTGENG